MSKSALKSDREPTTSALLRTLSVGDLERMRDALAAIIADRVSKLSP